MESPAAIENSGEEPSGRGPKLARRTDDRVIAGVASGVAYRLGIAPVYARAAFVVLAFAGGIGVVLYGIGWALLPDDRTTQLPPATEPVGGRQLAGLALAFTGVLLFLDAIGLWFGDVVVWPVALVSFGVAAVWDRGNYDYQAALTQIAGPDATARPSRGRVIVGGLLMFAGALVLFRAVDAFRGLGPPAIAVALTTIGFLVVFGPWVWRLVGDLSTERRQRIRSEERAEVAAHLHDSVLQTLALIQRSDDSKKMVTLARAQERELRSWLYMKEETSEMSLEAALQGAASRIEADHDVPVELVVVGDRAIGQRGAALVQAAIEAMTNAARHSGADRVSVYAEATDQTLDAWIGDQGSGFELDRVPQERLGISESIVGRMQRHRGTSEISSTPGEGTEVHLQVAGEGV
ncbi:MAG: ATP-binding protein [Acidimicrobiia bacterium]|nr:MAG: ATP-binding protein [Acidimicrobiia bacterium]